MFIPLLFYTGNQTFLQVEFRTFSRSNAERRSKITK